MVEAGANEIPEAEILDALDIAHDAIKKLCKVQWELQRKAGKAKKDVVVPQVDEKLYRAIQRSHGRKLDRATSVAGQARAPGRDEGRRGRGAREVRARRRRRADAQGGPARVRQAREDARARAHRRQEGAPGRPQGRRDPSDLDRGRRRPAHARLGALHARPDAGVQRRRARHDARGDAARHARAGDLQALLPPLQLPAVLGRGGRLHARPQAPRHRPRRARRARARADDPVARGVPVRDARRLGHLRVQRLVARWRRSAAPRCR